MGDGEDRPPLQLSGAVSVQVLLKKAHRVYWDQQRDNPQLDMSLPFWATAHQPDWYYNDEVVYAEYFTSLRIKDDTGLSLTEFFELDYYLATKIIQQAVKRAEKEMEEERKRREAEFIKQRHLDTKRRLKNVR